MGSLYWVVMLFRVKNDLPIYYMVVSITFKDYFDKFMKIFLDDFIMQSDMNTHLTKLILCFNNCKEFGTNLNLDKCAVMMFWRIMIFGLIIYKEGKLLDFRKIQAIIQMLIPTNPQHI